MDAAPARTDRIRGFDGLRALALAFVFLQHYTRFGGQFETGGYGVWMFFVLSGFLIVRILHGERAAVERGGTNRGAALRRFFWRRTLRIFPPYYLALGVFSVLALIGLPVGLTWAAAPWHYAYLSNVYFGLIAGDWVGPFGHFWSLAIEEQFYLLAAPALIFTPARWAKGVCAATVLASLAWNLSLRAGGASAMVVYTDSLINFGALAFGGWLGLSLPRRAREGTASWPAAAGLALILVFIAGFHSLGVFQRGTAMMVAIGPLIAATLFSGLIVAGLYLNQQSLAVRVLEHPWLRGFGRVSYGFYLYHNLLPHWLLSRAAAALGSRWRAPEGLEALFSFLIALGLALLSWKLIERPLLKLKDRPLLPLREKVSAEPADEGSFSAGAATTLIRPLRAPLLPQGEKGR